MILMPRMPLLLFLALLSSGLAFPQEAITFADPQLEAAVRKSLGQPEGPLAEQTLADLTYLKVSKSRIEFLKGLELCVGLEELDLSLNRISDLSPLAGLGNLTHLALQFNHIEDLEPLRRLTALTHLNLGKNKINDIGPLVALKALRELMLSQNRIASIEVLSGLKQLVTVHLEGNEVVDVGPLAGHDELMELGLTSNQVQSIAPLGGLSNLVVLALGFNRISDLGPVGGLRNLSELHVSANGIRDLTPLGALTGLTNVSLARNYVSDISVLATSLKPGVETCVDLRYNPLSVDALTKDVPALEQKGIVIRLKGSSGPDWDLDGLPTEYEVHMGTDPENPDSDWDGLTDGREVTVLGTDPKNKDTDGDGLGDGWEAKHGLDPLADDAQADPDGDGVSNILEMAFATDPRDSVSRPTAPSLRVHADRLSLTQDLPFFGLQIENTGDLSLEWTITVDDPMVRVVRPPGLPPMADISGFGWFMAGEDAKAGQGDASLIVVTEDYSRSRIATITIASKGPNSETRIVAVEVRGDDETLEAATAALILMVSPEDSGQAFADPSGGRHVPGSTVQVGAIPHAGFVFDRWQGAVEDPKAASTAITLQGDEALVAFFVPEQSP